MRSLKPLFMLSIVILIVSLACNLGGGSPTPTPVEPTQPPRPTATPKPADTETPVPTPTTVPTPSLAITNLQDVKRAIIQIEAQGTFMDPEFGLVVNGAGRGSGFIIDSSGIAVTNNHVVTGSALLKVWVGGDQGKVYNARILGVSECSDLAVIDIEGDGFPYLEWYDGAIDVGLDMYVAGFPLGDPEYTLTRGVVSKAHANGETSWASVESVIEYDATTNPGNSGGPAITADGKVIGVHYAGNSGTRQAFGISRDIATDVIKTLQGGSDLDAIGVNGQAVMSEDGSISGIWVSSVKSGSPADKAGLQGGDIITVMEGLVLATDGSMADYCDILRTHGASDTLSIEVLRWATQEYLSGQLNGRALEVAANLGGDLSSEGVETDDSGSSGTYNEYVTVTDDSGAIQVDVPAAWSDVNGSAWTSDGETIGAAISASADLDQFNNSWTESGMFFGVSDELAKWGGYVQLLDIVRKDFMDSCKYEGRTDYKDAVFHGKYDLFSKCGDQNTWFLVLTAVPTENSSRYLILLEMQITQDADLDAVDRILNSFNVIGALP